LISALCLIIKGLDNQAQKLNNQINQYPKKSLIVSLGEGRKKKCGTRITELLEILLSDVRRGEDLEPVERRSQ
jgi:hypothetical protein